MATSTISPVTRNNPIHANQTLAGFASTASSQKDNRVKARFFEPSLSSPDGNYRGSHGPVGTLRADAPPHTASTATADKTGVLTATKGVRDTSISH